MKKLIATVALAAGMLSALAAGDANIVPQLTESVKENWGKISALGGRAMTLRCEREHLPDRAWIADDKESHGKLIHDKVLVIRELLLSTSAQDLMKKVDAVDRKIAELDRDIHKESARDIFCPEDSGKSALAKLREKRRGLERQREEAVRVVSRELEALGLRLPGGAAEQCLCLADARDLIDVVLVAKSIGIVVERLRALMQSGDVSAAKRYFGIYLIMVEVQKTCYEIYLDKSRMGEWRGKIAQLKAEATTLRQCVLTSSANMAFSEQQRSAFARNAEVNAATMKAIDAYVKVLDQHEAVIQAKADEAAKMLLVAENSYKTVALTEEFLSLAKANQDSFEALLELQLPPIEMFNDAALLAEFAAITRKLNAEGANR